MKRKIAAAMFAAVLLGCATFVSAEESAQDILLCPRCSAEIISEKPYEEFRLANAVDCQKGCVDEYGNMLRDNCYKKYTVTAQRCSEECGYICENLVYEGSTISKCPHTSAQNTDTNRREYRRRGHCGGHRRSCHG